MHIMQFWAAGKGVSRSKQDSSVVVALIGFPALGKTTICEHLEAKLHEQAHVWHYMSDALPREEQAARVYWSKAADLGVSAHGRKTVVLADKNLLDKPRGVFPFSPQLPSLPAAPLLACCMSRLTKPGAAHPMVHHAVASLIASVGVPPGNRHVRDECPVR
jgi:hypothetical protein